LKCKIPFVAHINKRKNLITTLKDEIGILFMSMTKKTFGKTSLENIPHLTTAISASSLGKPILTRDSIFSSFSDRPCRRKSCIRAQIRKHQE
jgi:precorrin-3B methylase